MDHRAQHHEHHVKEREEKKKEQNQYEHKQEQARLPVHPVWLFGLGSALVLLAVLVWTLFLR